MNKNMYIVVNKSINDNVHRPKITHRLILVTVPIASQIS